MPPTYSFSPRNSVYELKVRERSCFGWTKRWPSVEGHWELELDGNHELFTSWAFLEKSLCASLRCTLLHLVCKRRTQPMFKTLFAVRLHILKAKEGSDARMAFQQRWQDSKAAFLSIVIGITCNCPAAFDLNIPILPPPPWSWCGSVEPSAVPYCSSPPLRSRQRSWLTWQQPLELVSIRAMYSAPFSRLP